MRIAAILSAAILSLMLLVAPVLAHHRDGHSGGPPSGSKQQTTKDGNSNDDDGTNRFGAEDAEDCEENAWNHGQYVSCVAHLVQAEQGHVEAQDLGLDSDCDGPGSLVACAAQSDIGKDEHGGAKSLSADNDNADSDNDNDNEED